MGRGSLALCKPGSSKQRLRASPGLVFYATFYSIPSLVWSSCVFTCVSAGRAGLDDAAQKFWKGGDVLEQLREERQWGCDTAEDAEKPRKGEEGSAACQEGLERLRAVGK